MGKWHDEFKKGLEKTTELTTKVRLLEEENAALKVERDILMASVSMIKDLANDDAGFMEHLGQRNYDALGDVGELYRRDARVKAEALEEASMLYPAEVCAEFDSIRADLQGAAHHYRKQAEEMGE